MGRKIAKIALSKAVYAIDKPYDYLIPAALEDKVQPGMRVLVPFGAGNRGDQGVVLSVAQGEEAGRSLKPVLALLDDAPV